MANLEASISFCPLLKSMHVSIPLPSVRSSKNENGPLDLNVFGAQDFIRLSTFMPGRALFVTIFEKGVKGRISEGTSDFSRDFGKLELDSKS